MGCVDRASDAAKKDMNIVYQKIYKIIKARGIPDITSKFETAQKNWIASREVVGCSRTYNRFANVQRMPYGHEYFKSE